MLPASSRAIADWEVFIRFATVFCEIRERLRIATRSFSSAHRWRASSIKEGNPGFFLVDSSIISSRKSFSITFSFHSSDLLAWLSRVAASRLIVALLLECSFRVYAGSFSETLLKRGVCDENVLRKQKGCDRLSCY